MEACLPLDSPPPNDCLLSFHSIRNMPSATTTKSTESVQQLEATLKTPAPAIEDSDARETRLKKQEAALINLGSIHRDNNDPAALAQLIRDSRSFLGSIAKAKTAKLSESKSGLSVFYLPPHSLFLFLTHQSACLLLVFTVRSLLDFFTPITPPATALQIEVTKESIDWAKEEKRVFLRQNLEVRLISL